MKILLKYKLLKIQLNNIHYLTKLKKISFFLISNIK